MTFIDENWPCRINLAPQCIMQANYHTLFLLRTQFLKRNTIYTCSCLTCRWIRIQFNITRVKQTWNLWYNIVFIDNNMKKKWNLIVMLNVYMYIHHKIWSTRGQHHHLSYNSHIKLNELYIVCLPPGIMIWTNYNLHYLMMLHSVITTFLGKWF